MSFGVAMSSLSAGAILSLLIIGAGLLWVGWRSIHGKELERRFIFLFIFVAASVPLFFHITFHEKITPIVSAVFDKIESLPPGSKVLISFDFDPAMAPEIHPMANAFVRHCLAKGHRVILMSLWGTGQSLTTVTIDNVIRKEFPDKKEHIDWVNLGYKAGNQGVLNVIVSNLRKMYPTDVNAVPLDSIPMLEGVRSCKDVSLVLALGGGLPGPKEWVLYVGDPGNVPICAGASAVTAPQLYPYYPKQMLGLLGGIKGAAEYETHLAETYERFRDVDKPGVRGMGPQALVHVVVMAFIVIANLVYFRSRRPKERA
jgi:hypothetical protein